MTTLEDLRAVRAANIRRMHEPYEDAKRRKLVVQVPRLAELCFERVKGAIWASENPINRLAMKREEREREMTRKRDER